MIVLEVTLSILPSKEFAKARVVDLPFKKHQRLPSVIGRFVYAAPKLWINLPHCIRRSSSLDVFKTKFKTHLFTIKSCSGDVSDICFGFGFVCLFFRCIFCLFYLGTCIVHLWTPSRPKYCSVLWLLFQLPCKLLVFLLLSWSTVIQLHINYHEPSLKQWTHVNHGNIEINMINPSKLLMLLRTCTSDTMLHI